MKARRGAMCSYVVYWQLTTMFKQTASRPGLNKNSNYNRKSQQKTKRERNEDQNQNAAATTE
jgi:hypothetical protein